MNLLSISISLLGRPDVKWRDAALTFRTRKALALLAYLAVENRAHSREALAALLWPAGDPSQRRMMLRTTLQHIRQAIPDEGDLAHILIAERESLSLGRDHLQLDLSVLEQAARALQETPPANRQTLLPQLQAAADMCRGEFMQGFALQDAPDFDHWVQAQAQRWRQYADAVFGQLTQLRFEAGDVRSALATAQRWSALDRLNDAAHGRLVELLWSSGDRAGALRAFELHAAALAQELNAQPSPDLLRLVERIRRDGVARPSDTNLLTQQRPREPSAAPMVGRAAEYARLMALLKEARTGAPQIVAIVGEAGIGKTRLAREFIHHAIASGADVWEARAFEAGGRVPYQAVLDAVRRRVEQENAPDDLLSDVWLAELSALLPELRERYPDLPPPLTVGEAEARTRRFEAAARLLQAAVAQSPVLIFVDDAQWADEGSLDLLLYLAQRCVEQKLAVLFLLTARVEDSASPQFNQWLDAMARTVPVTKLALDALTPEGTRQWVQAQTAQTAQTDGSASAAAVQAVLALSEWLHEETRGQPFYLNETLRALFERGFITSDGANRIDVVSAAQRVRDKRAMREVLGIPSGVRDLIRARIQHLSANGSDLLLAASTVGQTAAFETLQAVAALDERDGLRALDELLGARFVHEQIGSDGGAEYVVAHDKVRDVTYAAANEARRRTFHRRALESLRANNTVPAARLAYHAMRAGLNDEAARWGIAAGDEAMRVFDSARAVEHYERAQDLLGGALEKQDASALLRLGRAYELMGMTDKAAQASERLLTCAREANDATLETHALSRMAPLAFQSLDDARADDLATQLRASAHASGAPALQAQAEWTLAQIHFYGQRSPIALGHAERALTLAQQTKDTELKARVLNVLAYIRNDLNQYLVAMEAAEHAQALYAELHNSAMQSDTLALCATIYVRIGQPRRAVEAGREALQLAERFENPWGIANSGAKLAIALCEAGALGEAVAAAERAWHVALSHRLGLMIMLSQITLARVYREGFRLAEARGLIEAVRDKSPVESHRARGAAELCAVCALQGDWAEAGSLAREAATVRAVHPLTFERAVWLETEALLRAGETALAEQLIERNCVLGASSPLIRIHYLWALAVLTHWRGETAHANAHLQEALQLAEALALPNEAWQICAELGRHTQAEEIVRTLAASIGQAEARQGYLGAALARSAQFFNTYVKGT